ncbi:MAG TPA: STAS domain-containing protein [Actinomycetota bacterium]|jgi:anti-anti-sigma factor
MDLLTWTVEETAEAAVVRFAGELDMAGFGDAEKAVRAAEDRGKPLLILDFSDLTFMDSNGIHLLLLALQRAKEEPHRLALVPGGARRLLKVAGVLTLFDLLEDPAEPSGD